MPGTPLKVGSNRRQGLESCPLIGKERRQGSSGHSVGLRVQVFVPMLPPPQTLLLQGLEEFLGSHSSLFLRRVELEVISRRSPFLNRWSGILQKDSRKLRIKKKKNKIPKHLQRFSLEASRLSWVLAYFLSG